MRNFLEKTLHDTFETGRKQSTLEYRINGGGGGENNRGGWKWFHMTIIGEGALGETENSRFLR